MMQGFGETMGGQFGFGMGGGGLFMLLLLVIFGIGLYSIIRWIAKK